MDYGLSIAYESTMYPYEGTIIARAEALYNCCEASATTEPTINTCTRQIPHQPTLKDPMLIPCGHT